MFPYSFIDLNFSDRLLLILCYFLLSPSFLPFFFLSYLSFFPFLLPSVVPSLPSFSFISSFFLSFFLSFLSYFLPSCLSSFIPSFLVNIFLPFCSLLLTSISVLQDFERERGQSANSKVAQFVGKPSQSWTSSALRSSPTGRST